METGQAFQILGISLGLGLFVGLQRQWSGSRVAGVRTFSIVTLAGTVAALFALELEGSGGAFIIGAGVIAIAALAITSNVIIASAGPDAAPGMTTEITLVAMFLLGAYAAVGPPAVVMAVGVAIAVLLQLKSPLHGLAARFGEVDLRAVMIFAALTFVILPALPDRVILRDRLGDLAVWNPHHIWLMVVLISGISLAAYIAYKIVGPRAGVLLTGVLGGLVSSTATTFAVARRSGRARHERRKEGGQGLTVIALASSVVYARLLVVIWFVTPGFAQIAGGPLVVMLGVSAAVAAGVYWMTHDDQGELEGPGNPTELKAALAFAALYAVVLFAVALARSYLDERGLYTVAMLSGLTDMDAITLSMARLAAADGITPSLAWRAIVTASIANTVFKTVIVAGVGGRQLGMRMAAASGVVIVAGVALLVLWPV